MRIHNTEVSSQFSMVSIHLESWDYITGRILYDYITYIIIRQFLLQYKPVTPIWCVSADIKVRFPLFFLLDYKNKVPTSSFTNSFQGEILILERNITQDKLMQILHAEISFMFYTAQLQFLIQKFHIFFQHTALGVLPR